MDDKNHLQHLLDTRKVIPPGIYNIEAPIVPRFGAIIGDSIDKTIIRGDYGK